MSPSRVLKSPGLKGLRVRRGPSDLCGPPGDPLVQPLYPGPQMGVGGLGN